MSYKLLVKYFNTAVKLAIIRVGRDYISILSNATTFITAINKRKVKLRQLHCSGTIKKSEIKARLLLSMWLNNVLKNLTLNTDEKQELKTMVENEMDLLSKMEQ